MFPFIDHAMNQRRLVRRRCSRDSVAFFEQSLRARGLRLGMTMNRAECFANSNAIADLFVDDNADRGIDRIFLALAASAQNHASRPNLLAQDFRDVARSEEHTSELQS